MPTVTICSSEFVALGRAEAEALGMPALPLAVFKHPLGGLAAEEVRLRAASVLQTIEQLCTTPQQRLASVQAGPAV